MEKFIQWWPYYSTLVKHIGHLFILSLVHPSLCQPCSECLSTRLLFWCKLIEIMNAYGLYFQKMKRDQAIEKYLFCYAQHSAEYTTHYIPEHWKCWAASLTEHWLQVTVLHYIHLLVEFCPLLFCTHKNWHWCWKNGRQFEMVKCGC